MIRIGILILTILVAGGCREPDMKNASPARVINPGPGTQSEIETVVSDALDGAGITLAEDVLTDTSVLVIQRNTQRGINRPPVPGRDLGVPYRFRLVTDGSRCVLIDEQTEDYRVLETVECTRE